MIREGVPADQCPRGHREADSEDIYVKYSSVYVHVNSRLPIYPFVHPPRHPVVIISSFS